MLGAFVEKAQSVLSCGLGRARVHDLEPPHHGLRVQGRPGERVQVTFRSLGVDSLERDHAPRAVVVGRVHRHHSIGREGPRVGLHDSDGNVDPEGVREEEMGPSPVGPGVARQHYPEAEGHEQQHDTEPGKLNQRGRMIHNHSRPDAGQGQTSGTHASLRAFCDRGRVSTAGGVHGLAWSRTSAGGSAARPGQGLQPRCRPDSRRLHRRQHGTLLGRPQRPPAAPAVPRVRPHRAHGQRLPEGGGGRPVQLGACPTTTTGCARRPSSTSRRSSITGA